MRSSSSGSAPSAPAAPPPFLAPSPRLHLVFEPLDLLARLAAMVPRPRVNLILYHGVLAPNARWRAAVVSYAPSAVELPLAAVVSTATDAPSASGTASLPSRRNQTWAQLMQRAFDVDVLLLPCVRWSAAAHRDHP